MYFLRPYQQRARVGRVRYISGKCCLYIISVIMFDKRLIAFFSLLVFFLASVLYDKDNIKVLCVPSTRSRLIYEVSWVWHQNKTMHVFQIIRIDSTWYILCSPLCTSEVIIIIIQSIYEPPIHSSSRRVTTFNTLIIQTTEKNKSFPIKIPSQLY